MKPYRKRYLKVRIDGPALDDTGARRICNEAVLSFLGESNAAQARLSFMQWNPPFAIVRCSHDTLTNVVAALALKRTWQNQDVALRVEKVSGTIAALKKSMKGVLRI